ncbi:MOSC domain-containing protein [Pedobacter chinensis]|uniref:MOSC domain-containing protein n=1 Tax=Pedobacter chinensis TaxID=2282421 RepID=A0A369PQ60_9SPHI|nr:MOSC N-terminal beta barrel domain-containing protein [Pedobacter chinensis]RDC54694.1 MOSC domain-containing protein [Pedobacter chinensis]
MNKLYLSGLYIYPIKSLGGISLATSHIEERGLQHDRRWMLTDEEGMFITQRKHHELALLQVSIENDELIVFHKADPHKKISFPLEQTIGEGISVKIWDDLSEGLEVSESVSKWFSDFMQMKVRLVKMPAKEKRKVDPRYAPNDEIVSFADGYPCLIIGEASLNHLNQKLSVSVPMDRFRPNLVFSGGEAHVEDRFNTFCLNDILFSAVKPCARCVLITIDQQTGIKGQEPLKTLANYRRVNNKIMFGQNLIHQGKGMISVGDELNVLDWK